MDQIRLHWDQGALLKDIDVIGARGKNWPIKPGKDQARLVASTAQAFSTRESGHRNESAAGDHEDDASAANGGHQDEEVAQYPLATLSPTKKSAFDPKTPRQVPLAMRSSAKPPPRDYNELFMGSAESDIQESQSTSRGTSFAGGPQSAEKPTPTPAVVTSRNKYPPSRLFEENNGNGGQGNGAGEHASKPLSKRYDHFEFGDGSDATDRPPLSPVKSKQMKHSSQWDFQDFATPHKPTHPVRGQDVRHFGWSDDEVNLETPAQAKKVLHPRRAAESHFEFKDDGTPPPPKPQGVSDENKRPREAEAGRAMGSSHNVGMGLYQNNVYQEQGSSPVKSASPIKSSASSAFPSNQLPLGNVTNINNHRKNFGSQFTMTDDSPSSSPEKNVLGGASMENNKNGTKKKTTTTAATTTTNKKAMAPDRRAAVRMMESRWDNYEDEEDEESNAHDDDRHYRNSRQGHGNEMSEAQNRKNEMEQEERKRGEEAFNRKTDENQRLAEGHAYEQGYPHGHSHGEGKGKPHGQATRGGRVDMRRHWGFSGDEDEEAEAEEAARDEEEKRKRMRGGSGGGRGGGENRRPNTSSSTGGGGGGAGARQAGNRKAPVGGGGGFWDF